MNTTSTETVGRISSQGTDGTGSSVLQKPKRSRANTSRGNLELDQPLDRIESTLPTTYSTRRGVYAPTPRPMKAIKRSFWCNTIFGFIMIGILVFGSLFGIIYSVINTRGALKAGGTPDFNTNTDSAASSTPFVATTLVPSSFSTLVPSSYSTLVPTEITVFVESEATTMVHSDATTLVQSLVTLTKRDAATSAESTNNTPTGLVNEGLDITSTTSLTMSITTTVTVKFYSTTYGHYDMQSEVNGNGDSQQTCGNGAYNPCSLTINIKSETQSTFVTSIISTISASALDVDFTTAATDMPNSVATTAIATTNLPNAGMDKVTITYSVSMVCRMTDVSSMLSCSPVPTGWYISPSAPRATSVLHPVFRFMASCVSGIKDKGLYEFLRHGITKIWQQFRKVFIVIGRGEAVDNILGIRRSNHELKLKVWERIRQLA